MERFAIQELKKWKENPSRKPLVLIRARQADKIQNTPKQFLYMRVCTL